MGRKSGMAGLLGRWRRMKKSLVASGGHSSCINCLFHFLLWLSRLVRVAYSSPRYIRRLDIKGNSRSEGVDTSSLLVKNLRFRCILRTAESSH